MTREEAIKELRGFIGQLTEGCQEAIKVLIPELQESEDERIRKFICSIIDNLEPKDFVGVKKMNVIAWLEKQKEQKMESCDCSRDEECYINGIHHVLMNPEAYGLTKQKPAEWSEEDEAMRDNILRLLSCFVGTSECDSNPSLSTSYPAYQKEMDWLKSLKERMKGGIK